MIRRTLKSSRIRNASRYNGGLRCGDETPSWKKQSARGSRGMAIAASKRWRKGSATPVKKIALLTKRRYTLSGWHTAPGTVLAFLLFVVSLLLPIGQRDGGQRAGVEAASAMCDENCKTCKLFDFEASGCNPNEKIPCQTGWHCTQCKDGYRSRLN
jgi:hypothetical protein